MKKLFIVLILYFSSFLTLVEEEINIISKYLNYESFKYLIEKTNVLNGKILQNTSLEELNEILQKKWFQGVKKERWEFDEILFEEKENILNILKKDIYKKDNVINFKKVNEEIFIENPERFKDVKNIIIFGSRFEAALNKAICARSIVLSNSGSDYDVIFLTGYREIDKNVETSDEKVSEILKIIFPKIEDKNLCYKKLLLEKDFMEQLKDVVFYNVKNCDAIVVSEDNLKEGVKRATTESTLSKLYESNFLKKGKTIAISFSEGFINYQQSVVDLFFKKKRPNITVFGFNKNILNISKDTKDLLSVKLDNLSRIIYNCFEIFKINKNV